MQSFNLLEKEIFSDTHAHAEPLYVDKNGRVILFTLKPGQSISEHRAPSSPFYVVILSGNGIFTDGEGKDHMVGPNTLLVFDQGETHAVRALNEALAFIGFLHGAPGAYET